MLLHTPLYLLFLILTVGVYWLLPGQAWRKRWLVGASYVFYGTFSWQFALLLALLTVGVYFIAQGLPVSRHPRRLLWLGILLNLGLLATFKYLGFFLKNLQVVYHIIGLDTFSAGLNLLLPVGISFYTFQAITYLVEIQRGKLLPLQLIDMTLYLAFFPRLVAGPLVVPVDFSRQLANLSPRLASDQALSAVRLLLLGLFKKIVIADSLAVVGETAFRAVQMDSAALFPAPLYWQGFYLYAFLIYADFSGYTDLARASAMLLGFNLPENFQQPYFAPTIGAFWNRWHMSLTRWFREYLFFPLSRAWMLAGGRRHSTAIQVGANFVTMLLIGFWHGAAWTYIAWGAWHAILLSIERVAKIRPEKKWQQVLGGLVTFHLVSAGWVLFRAGSFSGALRFFQGMILGGQWQWLPIYFVPVLVTAGLVLGIDAAIQLRWGERKFASHWQPILATTVIVVLSILYLLQFLNGGGGKPFIYGQF